MHTEKFDIIEIKQIIIGFLTDSITDTERIKLDSWLNQDAMNILLFNEMIKIWQFSGTNKKSSEEELQEPWKKLKSRIIHQSDRQPDRRLFPIISPVVRRTLTMAASLVLALFIGGMAVYFFAGKSNPYMNPQKYEVLTPKGTRSEILLADGTKVWLNAGSTLIYGQDYNLNSREVDLVGEAFFKVKTDRNKPFTVKSAGLKIKAMGTSFNVKAYPGEKSLTATLVEGKLSIEGKSKEKGNFKYTLAPRQSMVFIKSYVTPDNVSKAEDLPEKVIDNRRIVYEPVIRSIEFASNVRTELYTSWKDKRWVIEMESLTDLTVMLERRYGVKILYKPDELKGLSFSGTIENETLEQLLDILKMSAPIKYEFGKGEVTLSMDKSQQRRFQKLINNPI